MRRSLLDLNLVLLATLVALLCPTACAAGHTNVARIGVLTPGRTFDPMLENLREEMARLGYREGSSVRFQIEDARGDLSVLSSLAVGLVDAKPDVLFTVVTAPTLAAKEATVLTIVSTREAVAQISLKQLNEAPQEMGVSVVRRDVTGAEDMDKLLLDRWAGAADAVFHLPSIFVKRYMEQLIAKALKERLPSIVHEGSLLRMGALVSYGGDFRSYGAQAAKLVDKILKGGRPMNIPIEVPDRLVLTINLASAKALGLKISRAALDRVDRFVE